MIVNVRMRVSNKGFYSAMKLIGAVAFFLILWMAHIGSFFGVVLLLIPYAWGVRAHTEWNLVKAEVDRRTWR